MNDILEIAAENILTTSKHSKEIKNLLKELIEKLEDVSTRITALESKQSNIFQIEVDEESDEASERDLSLEEEVELSEDD